MARHNSELRHARITRGDCSKCMVLQKFFNNEHKYSQQGGTVKATQALFMTHTHMHVCIYVCLCVFLVPLLYLLCINWDFVS